MSNQKRFSVSIDHSSQGEITEDRSSGPFEITMPVILLNDGLSQYWYHEPMDRAAAERFVESANLAPGVSAQIIDVPVVLPSADSIEGVLNDFECQPCRTKITETIMPSPSERVAAMMA